jgi:hypothetical protein
MTKPELSGCRFLLSKTDAGIPIIKLELFHNTAPSLKGLTVGFELLSGVSLDQAKTLVDAMNERIIGVMITKQ